MAKLTRLAGSTGHVLEIFVQDTSKTDGSGLAGLTNASAGLTCYYKRNLDAASVAVALTGTGTLGTFTSGLFLAVDATNMPGVYEFHPPNAAYASGAKSVVFMLKGAANMAPVLIEVELTAVDNQSTSFGLDKTGYVLAAAGLDAVVVESGVNARQALSPILAASAGVLSGAGTGTITIKGGNVATTRITATTDNAGNRSAVTLAIPT